MGDIAANLNTILRRLRGLFERTQARLAPAWRPVSATLERLGVRLYGRLPVSLQGPVSALQSCFTMALANLGQHKTRLAVAIVGTGVPIFLLTLQIAFLSAARNEVTRLYNYFDFDLAVVSADYQFLNESGSFDRIRLSQAGGVPGVAETYNLNIAGSAWTDGAGKRRSPVLVVGLDPPNDFVRDDAIRDGLMGLRNNETVLVDSFSSDGLGPLDTGTSADFLGGQPVVVGGHFRLGLFFYADGSTIVPNVDFPRFTGIDARQTSIGLIRLSPGADAQGVKAALAGALPDDVRVLTRGELIANEQAFFITTKPIGIMLRISMLIAFLVGAVILLQVLSAEIVNRIHEFATLKAMGFGPGFVLGVGLIETLALGLIAFLPALAVGAFVLWIVELLTHLPTVLSLSLALEVLAIVLLMSLTSGLMALYRIARADPAALY